MLIIISKNGDKNPRIKFKAETITDGMKIGIIKEKLANKGIPITLGMNMNNNNLSIEFLQRDLLDLLC